MSLKKNINAKLWDKEDNFYKVRTYVTEKQRAAGKVDKLVSVRELHGFTPWYDKMFLCRNCKLLLFTVILGSILFYLSFVCFCFFLFFIFSVFVFFIFLVLID